MNLLATNYTSWIFVGVLLVLMIVYFVWSSKSMKKREEEKRKILDESLRPGVEILTIGGITGVIVEISEDGRYFTIETGTENMKSYVKFDRVAFHSVVVHEEFVAEEETETAQEVAAEPETAEQPAEETKE